MILIKALQRIIILADFKSVEKKFVDKGADKEEAKKYLDFFKTLRDEHKLKADEKNIDTWGKKPFEEFQAFIDDKTSEKKHIRQLKPMEGATLVAENDNWFVYNITDYEASKRYGEGTKWCITQEKWWNKYRRRVNFYFLISKKLDEANKWFKIALQVPRKGKNTYWDSLDNSYDKLPTKLSVPKFTITKKEIDVSEGKLERLVDLLKDDYESQEEFYQSEEAYESYEEYLNEEAIHDDYRRHLNSSTEELVDELKELVYGEDAENTKDMDDDIIDILIECSDSSLVGMYYGNNEIASVSLGDQEAEVDDELQSEIEELSDEEKIELSNLLDRESVYIGRNFDHYSVGSEYNRLVLTLDEDKLDKYIESEKERQRVSELKEEHTSDLHKTALTSKHPKVVKEALNKITDKKVLQKIVTQNEDDSVKIIAVTKLGKLYKKDPLIQKFLQKIASTPKEDRSVRIAAMLNITDQNFLKSVISGDKKKWSTVYGISTVALKNIKDKDFIKKYGLKDSNLHEAALELINDPDYAKEMLKVKNPPYEAIIEKLPDSEQSIFIKLAQMPFDNNYGRGDYQKLAINRITNQSVLSKMFSNPKLDKHLKETILTNMDQDTLEATYKQMTPEQYSEYYDQLESAATKDSLVKALILRETKGKNQYHLSELLAKVQDEKWMLTYLKKLTPKLRSDVVRWMRHDNKERHDKLMKIFKIEEKE